MRSKVWATSLAVLSSLNPSSGWRRIASPSAMISSPRRSIAAWTFCISSALVMERSSWEAAEKGPAARRRPKAAREAYSPYVERAAEGAALPQMGPLSAASP